MQRLRTRHRVGALAGHGFVVLLVLTIPFFVEAATLVGTVIKVHDGDTITVEDAAKVRHSVRLAGIDAPELTQAFGQVAQTNLVSLVARGTVRVDWYKKDKYGRLVGKVYVGERDVNLEQLTAGLAWHYLEYQREQTATDRGTYAAAEGAARLKRVGLWLDSEPIAPWDWRRQRQPKL